MKLQDLGIQIDYKITSSLGLIYESRYSQEISAKIYSTNDEGDEMETIGTMKGYKLLLTEGNNAGFSKVDIFQVEEETNRYMKLLDKNCNIKSKHFEDVINDDILIITRIEILPEFRGLGISKFAIKDFIINFNCGCDIVAGMAFPLQFKGGRESNKNKPEYAELSKSMKESKNKLLKLYQEIGFKIDFGGLLTLSPIYRNDNLESINLDELT